MKPIPNVSRRSLAKADLQSRPPSGPRFSILVPDVAGNVLGAGLMLKRALEPLGAVEVVGPDLGHGINPMYRHVEGITAVPCPRLYRLPDFWRERGRLAAALRGEVLVAVKAYPFTLPLAVRRARTTGARVVAFLDEWDGAEWHGLSAVRRIRNVVSTLTDTGSAFARAWSERWIRRADAVVATSQTLAARFDGVAIPQGVDMDLFRRAAPERIEAKRRDLGLGSGPVVVFGGVARPHKGLDLTLRALLACGHPEARLLVVGPETEYLAELRKDPAAGPRVVATGAVPQTDMPLWLSLGDVTVLAQQDTPLARTQVPCKVFEAMAVGLPVIATDVSDLRGILDGCGWVVPPGDAPSLAQTLDAVFGDPEEARRRADLARENARRRYSLEAMRTAWAEVVGRAAPPGRGDLGLGIRD